MALTREEIMRLGIKLEALSNLALGSVIAAAVQVWEDRFGSATKAMLYSIIRSIDEK